MTIDESGDTISRSLGRLPVITPDAGRSEQLRARCRATLVRRSPPAGRTPSEGSAALVFGQVLVGGLCVIYLSAIVLDALKLRGIL